METMVIAKALLINPASEILVMRRSATDNRRPGQLDLPGGRVDEGEDINKAVVREIHEEAGITVAPSQARLLYAGTTRYEEISVTKLLYLAHVTDVVVRLSFEHDWYGWFNHEQFMDRFPPIFYKEGYEYAAKNDLLAA